MDAKIAIMENEMTNLKKTLATMLLMVEENQKKLMLMLERKKMDATIVKPLFWVERDLPPKMGLLNFIWVEEEKLRYKKYPLLFFCWITRPNNWASYASLHCKSLQMVGDARHDFFLHFYLFLYILKIDLYK
ncbi:hypothetical protein VIGAN_04010700 [Vigna angularis var. angularis]|uniref:Uncharacterized protein n=1 Tax=Vigna angularis var. angularis TaxID=157739 RepID=A0A0S3RR09_PHAAN|nr:hypothetical protein VIGAN_04010700 [Vigna angularis var. angularis]